MILVLGTLKEEIALDRVRQGRLYSRLLHCKTIAIRTRIEINSVEIKGKGYFKNWVS